MAQGSLRCTGKVPGTCPDTLAPVGFLDRMKKRPSHTETSIRQMLEAEGATAEEAQEIVMILSHRMSHDDMHVWLSHPQKAHGIPDPDTAGTFGVARTGRLSMRSRRARRRWFSTRQGASSKADACVIRSARIEANAATLTVVLVSSNTGTIVVDTR